MANSHVTNKVICERCGHESTTKGNLILHLKKKNVCPATDSKRTREDIIVSLTRVSNKAKVHGCNYCELMFSTSQGKHQHMKVCPKHPENELRTKVNKMEKIIAELQTELQSQRNNMHTTNNIQNQQNNNINIIINNFGNESTPTFSPEFLNHCLLNPSKGLASLIERIHYNPELPENHNLRHKSTKQNTLQKFVDHNWHDCDASNTLDELIRKGYRILHAYYSENVENNPLIIEDEIKAQIYGKFRFLSDKKSLEYSAVKRDLRLLVKDKTVFLLAPNGTQLNDDEMQEIQSEIVVALSYVE
jgi:hypothetical protein